MATIYNSDLSKELREGAKIQVIDRIPNELADKVVPVMEVNPKLLRNSRPLGSTTSGTTGSKTIFTAPTNKRTFITGISLAYAKNAACDCATGAMNIDLTPIGAGLITTCSLPLLTLTENNMNDFISFNPPMELVPGTTIVTNTGFTVGLLVRCVVAYGYLVDNNNA